MPDQEDQRVDVQDLDEWRKRLESSEQSPAELFQQMSRISLSMTFDLVDKLRWWEKETLKLPAREIQERIPHMRQFLDRLREAYLEFSEVDF